MDNGYQRSPAPPGAMVGVAVENIDEGRLIRELNAEISRAVKGLLEYEKETECKGTVAVSLSIVIEPFKGSDTLRTVKTKVTSKVPQRQSVSVAKEAGGKLLCQPVGTNEDPEQQVFFDSGGRMLDANGQLAVLEPKDSIPIGGVRRAQG